MREDLFQKTGLIIGRVAQDLLSKKIGDRIDPIEVYVARYSVSRGTIQNALGFLKDNKAIKLWYRGHLGTFIEDINYMILQQFSFKINLVGIMPLPYSKLYEGLATALYTALKDCSLNFNLAYVRGSESRIELVMNHVHDFAICSRHAAEQSKKNGYPIKIVLGFGECSYLSKHVLIFKDKGKEKIQSGMRVGIDLNSFDQKDLTHLLTSEIDVEYVNIHSHQAISSVMEGSIDVSVWNLDEILEKRYNELNVVEIDESTSEFSEAVIVIREDDISVEKLLLKHIEIANVCEIQKKVQKGYLVPSY
ncbi:MAG: GntR family transcriptional regulator YhfZ [Anaerorhabdus sp.]